MGAGDSGMRNLANLFGLTERRRFPASENSALLWGATSLPGKTSAQYIPHVVKERIRLRWPTDMLSPDVRSPERGLRYALG